MFRNSFTLFLITVVSLSHAQIQKNWKQDYLNKYAISYPSDWDMVKGKDEVDSTMFNIFSPSSSRKDIFNENVSVSKHRIQSIGGIDKEAEATIAYLKATVPEFKLIDTPVLSDSDFEKYFTIIYSGLMNNRKWRFYACLIYESDFMYNLMFLSPDKDFDKYLPEAQKIYNSFRILKTDEIKEE